MKVVILASKLSIYFYLSITYLLPIFYLYSLGIFPMYRNLEQTRYYTLFVDIYP